MKNLTDLSKGDFQKLLQIALQSLSIQRTLLENQSREVALELRTIERDDELEKIDRQLLKMKADYDFYSQYLDPSLPFDLATYYGYNDEN